VRVHDEKAGYSREHIFELAGDLAETASGERLPADALAGLLWANIEEGITP
jgi:hypothetical protein